MSPEQTARLRLKVAEELGAWVQGSGYARFLCGPEGPPWAMDENGVLTWSDCCPDWPNSLDACLRDLPTTPDGRRIGIWPDQTHERFWWAGPESLLPGDTASHPAVAWCICWLRVRGVNVTAVLEGGEPREVNAAQVS